VTVEALALDQVRFNRGREARDHCSNVLVVVVRPLLISPNALNAGHDVVGSRDEHIRNLIVISQRGTVEKLGKTYRLAGFAIVCTAFTHLEHWAIAAHDGFSTVLETAQANRQFQLLIFTEHLQELIGVWVNPKRLAGVLSGRLWRFLICGRRIAFVRRHGESCEVCR